jgi:hypothetical protein
MRLLMSADIAEWLCRKPVEPTEWVGGRKLCAVLVRPKAVDLLIDEMMLSADSRGAYRPAEGKHHAER